MQEVTNDDLQRGEPASPPEEYVGWPNVAGGGVDIPPGFLNVVPLLRGGGAAPPPVPLRGPGHAFGALNGGPGGLRGGQKTPRLVGGCVWITRGARTPPPLRLT